MRGLGFAPIIAVGAAGGPPGIAIAAIGTAAALLLAKFLPIGAGRKEADYLTDRNTGAQTKVLQTLDTIVAEYVPIKDGGQLSNAFIDATAAHIHQVEIDFSAYASQFSKAGAGAIATVRSLVSQLLASLEADRAYAHDPPVAPGVYTPIPGATASPGQLIQLGDVPQSAAGNTNLALLGLLALLFLWRAK